MAMTHLDAASAENPYDQAYLASNIEGGEGFDWFYASAADRDAQIRTPITDGGAGKPWVFRYKDLRSWWSNLHYDRPGGVEAGSPTAWVPQSKPIWFTEAGVPAVDKGTNQPNVFVDPKSAESALPYFSTGARDDLIQRRALEALLDYWAPAKGRNPISSVYSGPMVQMDRLHLWTWDARPYPDFPARIDVWADGPNWRLGHWLNGRLGLVSLSAVTRELAAQAGVTAFDASAIEGLVAGYVIDRPQSARSAIAPLAAVYGFDVADQADGLRAAHLRGASVFMVPRAALGERQRLGAIEKTRADPADTPVEARVSFIDNARDFRAGSVSARGHDAPDRPVLAMSAPVVLDHSAAEALARDRLVEAAASAESVSFQVPPSLAQIEPGDVIALEGEVGQFLIVSADGSTARVLESVRLAEGSALASAGVDAGLGVGAPAPSTRPYGVVMDLPLLDGETERAGPRIAARAQPWPGDIVVSAGPDLNSVIERVRLVNPARLGSVVGGLGAGPIGRWDDATVLRVSLNGAAPVSADPIAVLGGANLIAVRAASGWEIIAYATALAESGDVIALSGLLRGLYGTDVVGAASDGAEAVLLDGADTPVMLNANERGVSLAWRFAPVGAAADSLSVRDLNVSYDGADARPYAPVHVRARRGPSGIELSWVRRSRIGGDDWEAAEIPLGEVEERYRVEIIVQGVAAWSAEVQTPLVLLSPVEEASLFPTGAPSTLNIRVAQYSQTVGYGPASDAFVTIDSI